MNWLESTGYSVPCKPPDARSGLGPPRLAWKSILFAAERQYICMGFQLFDITFLSGLNNIAFLSLFPTPSLSQSTDSKGSIFFFRSTTAQLNPSTFGLLGPSIEFEEPAVLRMWMLVYGGVANPGPDSAKLNCLHPAFFLLI